MAVWDARHELGVVQRILERARVHLSIHSLHAIVQYMEFGQTPTNENPDVCIGNILASSTSDDGIGKVQVLRTRQDMPMKASMIECL